MKQMPQLGGAPVETFNWQTFLRTLMGVLMAMTVAVPIILLTGDPPASAHASPDSVAIMGYDTVAYFTEGHPIKGKPEFAYSWHEAQWHFANADHRDLFAADPQRYAPQFGGLCSMALTTGHTIVADPEIWTIIDGKLYLSFTSRGLEEFREHADENIKKAEAEWAKIQEQD